MITSCVQGPNSGCGLLFQAVSLPNSLRIKMTRKLVTKDLLSIETRTDEAHSTSCIMPLSNVSRLEVLRIAALPAVAICHSDSYAIVM